MYKYVILDPESPKTPVAAFLREKSESPERKPSKRLRNRMYRLAVWSDPDGMVQCPTWTKVIPYKTFTLTLVHPGAMVQYANPNRNTMNDPKEPRFLEHRTTIGLFVLHIGGFGRYTNISGVECFDIRNTDLGTNITVLESSKEGGFVSQWQITTHEEDSIYEEDDTPEQKQKKHIIQLTKSIQTPLNLHYQRMSENLSQMR